MHAQAGNRSTYGPLTSPLASSPDPVAIVEGLLYLYPFETLYVADLDGIMRGVPDLRALDALRDAFADLEIWLDNGARDPGALAAHALRLAPMRPVIGTEILEDPGDFAGISDAVAKLTRRRPILSLDFKQGRIIGADLLSRPAFWPDTIIVMNLDEVGARRGPDLERLIQIRSAAPRARIVAAGGVRDKDDLITLSEAGVDAALVATALHAETLKTGDLVEIAGLR